MEKTQRHVARAAILVMAAFAVSRILGLVRQIVFGHYFGTGAAMDAYVAAQRIPEAIFFVVAGGALGSAFIPMFTGRLARGETESAWKLASAVINILLIVLVPLSLLCIAFAPWLVRTLIAPALPAAVQAQVAVLMRVMLLSTAIFGVSGVVMGILNAHQHFLLPAIAPILYNLALIGGGIWGGETGLGPLGPAIGTVVGALAHLLIQVPGLIRYGAHYAPIVGRGDPGVMEVGRLMAPRVLGVAATQVNMLVTNNLASHLGAGAIAALEYAWLIVLLPQGVFAQAVGTAVFPTFAEQAARGETDALRRTLMLMLRVIVAVTLPAAVGLMTLGRPIIAVVFQRGEFDAASTQAVAWALTFYAVGLVGLSAIEVLARAFYALHDTWTPALAALLSVALNLALGLTLPSLFTALGGAAHGGLALASALAFTVQMAVLLVLVYRRIGGFDGRGLAGQALRVLLASVGMGVALLGWMRVAPDGVLVQSLGGVAVGVIVYVGLALALRVEELKQVARMVLRKG
ncbi:MAG TPA: murein biosynthesis integral membrane protein MurJ [Anaerolineae bacterium]|nr:murein biosynthesis integral membrane protein MurJ [Anaerolineae bacterium]HQH39522.1 murein biosynthesis integral membrane protein MurJ [Anaerolineae bacterium]